MPFYQSYSQVFVTNSPALLAEGKTVDSLAVGQIGLLDAKTYKAVTSPTYAKNKALLAVWGTPNVTLGDFGGTPNENEYSKEIVGKRIKRLRAKKAQRGQTPIYTIGWSGDAADTDTLSAKTGESKDLFIKLSGTVIDRLYSKQGIVKQFKTTPACIDGCADAGCDDVKSPDLAKELVAQINADKDFSKFIKAKALIECVGAPVVVETDCFKFKLNVCDTGDDVALGLVQSQYPSEKVVRIDRVGSISSYGVVKSVSTAPSAFNAAATVVAECATCPVGATLVAEAKVFTVKTSAGETVGDVQSAFTGEASVTVLNSDPQFNTFTIVFPTSVATSAIEAEAVSAGYVLTFIGVKRNICQLPASTITWAADGTLKQRTKKYRITLSDDCGSTRLASLQAAYPSLVISVVNSAGSCVHTYETTVKSNCYEVGCAISEIKFEAPAIFEGAEWVEVPDAAPTGDCKAGVQIETVFINRKTNEATFGSFPYENDIVHVQISNYNPDFNADPCENPWVVKQIRQVKFPQGNGQYIQHLEKESKQYDQRFRHHDAVMREAQGYSLQADPNKFYDEYVIEFETKWKSSGGWAEDYTQSFHLTIFVPEGQGQALETALNSYVTSAGLGEEAIAI